MRLAVVAIVTIWLIVAIVAFPGVQTLLLAITLGVALAFANFVLTLERQARRQASVQLELTVLRQTSLTDALTTLGNRRSFQDEIAREVSRSLRTEQPLSLAFLDIDDFKIFNDTRGHMAGDFILAELANGLLSHLRIEDRAFRVGGDEFAVLMPNTSAEGAKVATARLKTKLQERLADLKLSIGIATAEAGEANADSLTEQADQALYGAKQKGKDQSLLFQAQPDAMEVRRAKEDELRALISGSGPEITFQPIYELETRKTFAYEAFMRLPQGSRISGPLEAFEMADRMGLLFQLDSLSLDAAVTAAAPLLSEDTNLFLNIDPRTMLHPSFSPVELFDRVRQYEIAPERVILEVTERSTVPVERLARAADRVRAMGFKLAIDNVGTGNSGLEMLRCLRFDYIKIDRSVVLDAINGRPGKAVMMAILAFAAESNTQVIAEGIESAAMLNVIEAGPEEMPDISIRAVQGFFFDAMNEAKPAEANASAPGDAVA